MFVGLVVRDHLMKLLLEAVKRGTCEHLEVPYNELNHQVVDASALESETQQQMAVLEVRGKEKQGERNIKREHNAAAAGGAGGERAGEQGSAK